MFERFTERARQVVVLAQDEAKVSRHTEIGRSHLLAGLMREEEGLGARALENLGVTLEAARELHPVSLGDGEWEAFLAGRDPNTVQIGFTTRGKKVLELGLREALSLGHNHIGTEHLLLALARSGFDVPGVDFRRVMDEVIRLLMAESRDRARQRRVELENLLPRREPEFPTARDMLEEDRRELEGVVGRLSALQMELACRGYYSTVTTYRVNESRSPVPPEGGLRQSLAGWRARLNVVYEVFDRPAMRVLEALAVDHGCDLQWNQKHGATFYPHDRDEGSVAVVVHG